MLRTFERLHVFGILISVVVLLGSACGSSTATLTVASPGAASARPAAQFLTPRATPGPVIFPVDDGPHNDLTEWWYYTGHLTTADGRDYGFEFVIFQVNRAGFPPVYASHFAITDVSTQVFHYDQRTQSGRQPVARNQIDLRVGDWALNGDGNRDHISAAMAGYSLDLTIDSQKPPALHDGDGYFEWAPATGSYYYSRTSMTAAGTLNVNGVERPVTGQAWMDHQWGNFLLSGGGGWDWYSIQLDNHEEIMLWHSRDSRNAVIFGSGTIVDTSGRASPLGMHDFTIDATGTWTSPRSGADYPSGWVIQIPAKKISLTIDPVLKDQELDTRQSTGVIYWEGDVRVSGTADGQPIAGQGYVELTGYASSTATP